MGPSGLVLLAPTTAAANALNNCYRIPKSTSLFKEYTSLIFSKPLKIPSTVKARSFGCRDQVTTTTDLYKFLGITPYILNTQPFQKLLKTCLLFLL